MQLRPVVAALAALAMAFAAFAIAPPSVALAHAELVGSEPADGSVLQASPPKVQLYFSEPIEPAFFAVEVYNAGRNRVDRRDARIAPTNVQTLEAGVSDLAAGIYTVVWRALSIDGHVVRGAFAFSVGVAAPAAGTVALPPGFDTGGTPFDLGAMVRWLTYTAAAVVVGGLAFLPLVLFPVAGGVSPAAAGVAGRLSGRILAVAWVAVAGLLGLTLLALLVQASEVSGQPLGEVLGGQAVTQLLTATKYGTLWLARAALVVALLFALMAAAIQTRPRAAVLWTGFALGAGLLLVLAATGHASAVPRRSALAIGADWLHLLAGAVWVGGLIQLALIVPGLLAATPGSERRPLLARLVRRFSAVASTCVAVVVATGIYAGTVHVPTWGALADTFYGAALSGKLLLVAPLLVLGAVNLAILGPRLARPPAARARTGDGARLFRRVVLAEVVLAVLVFGVTGILSGLPPATASPGEGTPVTETARAGDLTVTLQIDPNQAGVNTFRITVADAQVRPVQLQRVTLLMTHRDMDMGQREVDAINVGANRFEAVGGYLSMAGRWQTDVRLRRAGAPAAAAPDLMASFTFTTGQPPGFNRPLFSPARIIVHALTPQTALGVLIILLAGVLYVQRGRLRRSQRLPVALAGATLGLIGVAATGTSLAAAYLQSVAVALPVNNPIPATPESIARGQVLYTQSCLVCHGATGRGDGPAGRALRPPPADFRTHMAAGHTDAQLFDWLSNGVPGTAMAAFKDALSVEDRWHLINFIRTFADPSAAPGAGGP